MSLALCEITTTATAIATTTIKTKQTCMQHTTITTDWGRGNAISVNRNGNHKQN